MKKILVISCILFTGCTSVQERHVSKSIEVKEGKEQMRMLINEQEVPITWEDNVSVQEIQAYVEDEDIVVSAHMYGGFEQVGDLPQSFTSNDTQMTSTSGDVFLYQGNQVVVFFGSNSWSYTKLGHITVDTNVLHDLLNKQNCQITITNQ